LRRAPQHPPSPDHPDENRRSGERHHQQPPQYPWLPSKAKGFDRLDPGRIDAGRWWRVVCNVLDQPQIREELRVRGVFREPLAHDLRVPRRRLAGQVTLEQGIETLVFDVHTAITGQLHPNPQTSLPLSSLYTAAVSAVILSERAERARREGPACSFKSDPRQRAEQPPGRRARD